MWPSNAEKVHSELKKVIIYWFRLFKIKVRSDSESQLWQLITTKYRVYSCIPIIESYNCIYNEIEVKFQISRDTRYNSNCFKLKNLIYLNINIEINDYLA